MDIDLHKSKKNVNDTTLISQYVLSSLPIELSYWFRTLSECQPLPNELISNILPVKQTLYYGVIYDYVYTMYIR